MIILPIISPKGGEGKSTHAANLAGFFADAGFR
ncbi:ParA family protein, partial [Xenorhabdus innexi]